MIAIFHFPNEKKAGWDSEVRLAGGVFSEVVMQTSSSESLNPKAEINIAR
jgi:hypothetical protein